MASNPSRPALSDAVAALVLALAAAALVEDGLANGFFGVQLRALPAIPPPKPSVAASPENSTAPAANAIISDAGNAVAPPENLMAPAANNGASSQITPLPSTTAAGNVNSGASANAHQTAPPPAMRLAGCWRYGEAEAAWTRLPDLPLGACVSTLYVGICDTSGPPAYGRWADRTLRLVEGRVEISADNRNFSLLADHNPGCPARGNG